MPGVPRQLAQDAPSAQDGSQLQTWVDGWLSYLGENLPALFVVVAVLVGIVLLVRAGIKQTVMFAVGAALVLLLLTNLESVAAFFEGELPLPPADSLVPTGPPEPPAPPEPTADPE